VWSRPSSVSDSPDLWPTSSTSGPVARDQIRHLPPAGTSGLAAALEVLQLVPDRGEPLNADNPTGGLFQLPFGAGRGLITYLLLADQDRVDVLRVTWLDLGDRVYSFDGEIPLADSSLIMDLFDMFSVLETALDKLDEDALAEVGNGARHLLAFGGFDHQNPRESQLAGFAEHLIDDDRWTNLSQHSGNRPGEPSCPDSHTPMLERYQRMLTAYDKITHARATPGGIRGVEAYRFDLQDLKTMLGATRYPDAPSS
jgi:uncharacterized protein YfbU (UPF0304 family)